MYRRISKTDAANIIQLRIGGTITGKESDELSHMLEKEIARSGKIRLFLIMDYYPGTDIAEALYEDLRFVKIHADNIERMAVVGEKAVQDTWIGLFGLFSGVNTAYFDRSEIADARQWILKT